MFCFRGNSGGHRSIFQIFEERGSLLDLVGRRVYLHIASPTRSSQLSGAVTKQLLGLGRTVVKIEVWILYQG